MDYKDVLFACGVFLLTGVVLGLIIGKMIWG